MSKFKNSFIVYGAKSLLSALRIELDALGYSYKHKLGYKDSIIVFNGEIIENGMNSHQWNEYYLPQHWDIVLGLAAEKSPEYKVGDWVWTRKDSKSAQARRCATELTPIKLKKETVFSGADAFFTYFTKAAEIGIYVEDIERLATAEEIKVYLVGKANSLFKEDDYMLPVRELKIGDMWENTTVTDLAPFIGDKQFSPSLNSFKYNPETDTLTNWDRGLYVVYENSVFAAKKETDVFPRINGYDGKWEDNLVKYGCAIMHPDMFRTLEKLERAGGGTSNPKINRSVTSITLSSGVTITMKQVKEIVAILDILQKTN